MLHAILNLVTCSHRRTTFPLTVPDQDDSVRREPCGKKTYVVCLDCGKELPYSWEELRMLPPRREATPRQSPSPLRHFWAALMQKASRLRDAEAVLPDR